MIYAKNNDEDTKDVKNELDELGRWRFRWPAATEKCGPTLVGLTLGERRLKRALAGVGDERPRTFIGDDFLEEQVHVAFVVDDAHGFPWNVPERGDFEGHFLRSRAKDARDIRLGRARGHAHFKRHLVLVLGPFEILMRARSKVFG